ncbi:YceK/YidQ family lipoprotein [Leptospira gomenensis]|uniref:YceK/YidQ family lipoprotein n=1 Tax=Leptospira gomenensis TaxID=2484974 RepID=UPI001FEB708D|nr:YceK/YidQ family lipoprotein [Leptospira gomenensis]
MLPITLPNFIYVKSGRPWSSSWYHRKYEKGVTSFREQNPPYIALKSIIANNDLNALRRFLDLYDVTVLERKIRELQEKDLLPYEHSGTYNFFSNQIGIIDHIASVASAPTYVRRITIHPRDRLEIIYTLYEEFRKDPELEKRYYDTVWKIYFSSGELIENPTIFKKVVRKFIDRKEISQLIESTANKYYRKESDRPKETYFNPDSKTIPRQISESWKEKIDLLTEIDDILQKKPALLKEWRSIAWNFAISSGLIAHRPAILEKAYREFPKESANADLILFLEANKGKNQRSIDIIAENIKDPSAFPLDRIEEKTVRYILMYPNVLEKLIQVGWPTNQILKWKKEKFNGRKTYVVIEEKTLLVLSIEDDLIPEETIRILLKHGADPKLGVKSGLQGKHFILYPMSNSYPYGNSILKESKQKLIEEWNR